MFSMYEPDKLTEEELKANGEKAIKDLTDEDTK